MKKDEAKLYAKGQLESFLQTQGINTGKMFKCICRDHEDRHPSMSFYRKSNTVHCFACGKTLDIFGVVSELYGVTGKEMFDTTYSLLGIQIDGRTEKRKDAAAQQRTELPAIIQKTEEREDFSGYIEQCAKRAGETDYWKKRGLSAETIARFKLGFDPYYTRGTARPWKAAIIPTGKGSFVARNTFTGADEKNRYRKTGKSELFNPQALYTGREEAAFIVEGEIDALSVEEMGFPAMALGSVANADAFLRSVALQKPEKGVLIAMDADKAGRKTAEKLRDGLNELGVRSVCVYPYTEGAKDANESLLADRDAFYLQLARAQELLTEKKSDEEAQYVQENSALGYLDEFLGEISSGVDTPCIPTGFAKLDASLDGGLFEGLYCIGAISSLGKTTFVLQMADVIAKSGRDVLIVSLEMSKRELVSKSISRETLALALERGLPAHMAKTSRGITMRSRYEVYTQEEKALIADAAERYRQYAGHIFIHEGVGNVGVAQVADMVEKHIGATGRTPVVVVDYLQILSPFDPRYSDKQNTDRAVVELKRLSRDRKTPIIAVSAFNRANSHTEVSFDAFRESSAIEYGSDVLIGLQLHGVGMEGFDVNAAKSASPRRIQAVILKNRCGRTGDILCYEYYPMFNFFREK